MLFIWMWYLYFFCFLFLQWTQLQQRKQSLKKLFIKIQDWQHEKVREEPDKVLTEDNRVLQEDDIQRYFVTCMYWHIYTVHVYGLILNLKSKDTRQTSSIFLYTCTLWSLHLRSRFWKYNNYWMHVKQTYNRPTCLVYSKYSSNCIMQH